MGIGFQVLACIIDETGVNRLDMGVYRAAKAAYVIGQLGRRGHVALARPVFPPPRASREVASAAAPGGSFVRADEPWFVRRAADGPSLEHRHEGF
jgi:hypothetical protein